MPTLNLNAATSVTLLANTPMRFTASIKTATLVSFKYSSVTPLVVMASFNNLLMWHLPKAVGATVNGSPAILACSPVGTGTLDIFITSATGAKVTFTVTTGANKYETEPVIIVPFEEKVCCGRLEIPNNSPKSMELRADFSLLPNVKYVLTLGYVSSSPTTDSEIIYTLSFDGKLNQSFKKNGPFTFDFTTSSGSATILTSITAIVQSANGSGAAKLATVEAILNMPKEKAIGDKLKSFKGCEKVPSKDSFVKYGVCCMDVVAAPTGTEHMSYVRKNITLPPGSVGVYFYALPKTASDKDRNANTYRIRVGNTVVNTFTGTGICERTFVAPGVYTADTITLEARISDDGVTVGRSEQAKLYALVPPDAVDPTWLVSQGWVEYPRCTSPDNAVNLGTVVILGHGTGSGKIVLQNKTNIGDVGYSIPISEGSSWTGDFVGVGTFFDYSIQPDAGCMIAHVSHSPNTELPRSGYSYLLTPTLIDSGQNPYPAKYYINYSAINIISVTFHKPYVDDPNNTSLVPITLSFRESWLDSTLCDTIYVVTDVGVYIGKVLTSDPITLHVPPDSWFSIVSKKFPAPIPSRTEKTPGCEGHDFYNRGGRIPWPYMYTACYDVFKTYVWWRTWSGNGKSQIYNETHLLSGQAANFQAKPNAIYVYGGRTELLHTTTTIERRINAQNRERCC